MPRWDQIWTKSLKFKPDTHRYISPPYTFGLNFLQNVLIAKRTFDIFKVIVDANYYIRTAS